MKRSIGLLFLAATAAAPGCLTPSGPPLPTVPALDLNRYAGTWYEIASYPAPFQKGCTGTTAEYTIRPDGRVGVINRCNENALDGPEKTIEGSARVPDAQQPAKLAVTFFWPFEAPYWVIGLGEDYEYAVVGEPTRTYLWILSRTPQMDDARYAAILADLPALGYDPAKLRRTPQAVAQE